MGLNLPRVPAVMPGRVRGEALVRSVLSRGNPHMGGGRLYTSWRAKMADTSRPFYIVTEGEEKLPLGDQRFYLVPLDNLDFMRGEGTPGHFELPALEAICKDQGLAYKEIAKEAGKERAVDAMVDELEALHRVAPIFFRREPPYPLQVLVDLGEELPASLDLALRGGWTVDQDLALAMRPFLCPVDPATIPPRVAMRSAPHQIDILGTKAGKSSIGARIGRLVERPTPAGLLGFADSEKVVHGILHGASLPVLVDEIAQEPREEAARAISTYLEVGEVEIPRGIGLTVRGWAPVAFLGNPPPGTDAYATALEAKLAVLRALTSTQAEALGSRTALEIFKPRSRPASPGGALEGGELAKAEALIVSFQAHIAPLVSAALQEERVVKWIAKGFPQGHVDRILRAAERVAYPEIAAFLRGYAHGHRHARGLALRLALLDTAHIHLKDGEVDVAALLRRADEVWPRVVALREESLQELVHVAGDEEIRRAQIRTRWGALSQEYLRRALGAIALWAEDQEKGIVETPSPLEAVRESYLASPMYDREEARYWSWPMVCRTLERNINVASELAEPFGVRFSVGQYGAELRVRDAETFHEAMAIIGVAVREGPLENDQDDQDDQDGGGASTPENPSRSETPDRDDQDGTRSTTGQTSRAYQDDQDGGPPDSGTKSGSVSAVSVVSAPPAPPGAPLKEKVRAVLDAVEARKVPALPKEIAEDKGLPVEEVEKIVDHLVANGELVQEPTTGAVWRSRGGRS